MQLCQVPLRDRSERIARHVVEGGIQGGGGKNPAGLVFEAGEGNTGDLGGREGQYVGHGFFLVAYPVFITEVHTRFLPVRQRSLRGFVVGRVGGSWPALTMSSPAEA